MDILRRSYAPISTEAWAQIDDIARQALATSLSARRFVDVIGPLGLECASVALGRLSVPEEQSRTGVGYGVHQVLPLVETRIGFKLEQWELDNVGRGAKDIQLDSLVDAARKIAAFEENAIYHGFAPSGIVGIHSCVVGKPIKMPLDPTGCIDAVGEAQVALVRRGVEGNSALVASPKLWKLLARNTEGGTLKGLIQGQIGGPVVLSETVTDGLLVSLRGGDLELTIGQDLAIGYLNHDPKGISLYLTESFTFRVVAPEAIVAFAV